jgi:hypothetical protein
MNYAEIKQSHLASLAEHVKRQVQLNTGIHDSEREQERAARKLEDHQRTFTKVVEETKATIQNIEGGFNNHFMVEGKLYTLIDGAVREVPCTVIAPERGNPAA